MDIGKKFSEMRVAMESSFNTARAAAKDLSKSVKNMFHEKSSTVKSELKNSPMPTTSHTEKQAQPDTNMNKFLQEARLVNQNKYHSGETSVKPQQNQKTEEKKTILDDKALQNLNTSINQAFRNINTQGKAAQFESFSEVHHSDAHEVLANPNAYTNEQKLAALDLAKTFLSPDKNIQDEFKLIQGKSEDFRQFCGSDYQKIEDAVLFPDSAPHDDKILALKMMKSFNEKEIS